MHTKVPERQVCFPHNPHTDFPHNPRVQEREERLRLGGGSRKHTLMFSCWKIRGVRVRVVSMPLLRKSAGSHMPWYSHADIP
jgi:hypothetical protein